MADEHSICKLLSIVALVVLMVVFVATPEHVAYLAPDKTIDHAHVVELMLLRIFFGLLMIIVLAIILLRKRFSTYAILQDNYTRWWASLQDHYEILFHGRDLVVYSGMTMIILFCILISLSFQHHAEPWFNTLMAEDGVIETLQWLSLLVSACIMSIHLLQERRYRKGFALFFGWLFVAFLLFIIGEELDWGQRIFGFATPEWLLRINTQHEFNLHNIGNYWLNDVQTMVLFGYFILLPLLAYHYPKIYFLLDRSGVPTPPMIMPVIASIGLLFNETYPFIWGNPPYVRLSELREALFYLCVLLTVAQYFHVRREIHAHYFHPREANNSDNSST